MSHSMHVESPNKKVELEKVRASYQEDHDKLGALSTDVKHVVSDIAEMRMEQAIMRNEQLEMRTEQRAQGHTLTQILQEVRVR